MEMNPNSMSVPSTTSTGFGYLVLTAPLPDYLALDPTAFPAPTTPGLNLDYARAATSETMTGTNCQHRLLREDFNLYWALEWALKTLLVAAVPHLFIAELYDEMLG